MMVEIESANGVFLFGPDNKKYIDLISGVSVSALGHSHPRIIQAVKDQADKHMHLMVYGEFIQSPQIEYATLLAENLPASLNSVYFTNSGTEAIEGAMKLAKRLTGRPEMASFKNAYHGSTQGALSILGSEYFKTAFRPLLPGTHLLEYNNFNDLDRITENTACVVAEVLQSEAGVILPTEGFIKALRQRCDQTGCLLILDEVQTGFGRTGSLFGFTDAGIVPDILVLAKSFGGGMPLGAFISSTERMNSLTDDPVLGHITTFGGHPVSCAAGMECLKIILEDNLISLVKEKEDLFRMNLKHPLIKEIRGKGLLLAVELGNRDLMLKLINAGIEFGFISDWFLFCDTAFRISPPLNITNDEIILSCSLIIKALNSI
jgi:acetylornithine/succinyldiaminopimelate/putrescine aminotransferase